MTNKEKMLAGQVYDPNDEEIVSEQFEYLNAMKAYNALPYGDSAKMNTFGNASARSENNLS